MLWLRLRMMIVSYQIDTAERCLARINHDMPGMLIAEIDLAHQLAAAESDQPA